MSKSKREVFTDLRNKRNGITLIALVVTIIVLLILAGVAISLTIGQNGIFSRAQTAVNTWRESEANEQLAMGELEDWMDEAINGPQAEEGTLSWMYEQALQDNCTNADGSCNNPNHLHIGDYVDFNGITQSLSKDEVKAYDSKTGATSSRSDGTGNYQSYTVNSSTNQVNWRVLGYDGNTKQVKLIAATPLKANDNDGYLVMYGAQSYETGYLVPDEISSEIYEGLSYVADARSVKESDIDELVGITADNIRDYNLDPFYGGKNYGDPYNFPNAYSPAEVVANPTGYRDTPAKGLSGTVDGYYYTVNGVDNDGEPYVNLDNQRIYNMLFNDTEIYSGGAYWLSSRGVYANSGLAHFGPCRVVTDGGVAYAGAYYLFNADSDGIVDEYDGAYAVRSVVSLTSDAPASEIPKIADKTEEPWGDG